jgi:hypothetical protein
MSFNIFTWMGLNFHKTNLLSLVVCSSMEPKSLLICPSKGEGNVYNFTKQSNSLHKAFEM